MNYLNKQKLILDTLVKTNYESFNGNKRAALEFIEQHLLIIAGFSPTIVTDDIMTKTNSRKTETSDKKANIIESINSINELCEKLKIEKFMDIDTTDTNSVKNAIGEFTLELYNKGIGKTT